MSLCVFQFNGFSIRYTYSLARHCIETADSRKHDQIDHSFFLTECGVTDLPFLPGVTDHSLFIYFYLFILFFDD